jgi:Asp-tRNA(Asn)/Glu-tRNA(Gln) amidotransferase A subunit family amidase
LTRTVRDAALMLGAMAGHDPKDSTSVDLAVPDYAAALTGDIKGLRVGIPAEYRMDGMPDEIETLWQQGREWLADAGAEIVDLSLPHTKYALPTYYIVAPAEASSNLARYDGMRYGLRVEGEDLIDTYEKTRAAGFGPEVKRRVMIGTYVLSAGYYDAYYLQAQKVRTRIADEFRTAWGACDVILTPTTPSAHRRTSGGQPRGLPSASQGTNDGTGARARGRPRRSRAGRRSSGRHRVRGRTQVGARDRLEGTDAAVRAIPQAHQKPQAANHRRHRNRP